MIFKNEAAWWKIMRCGYGIPLSCLLGAFFGISLWILQEVYTIRCVNCTQGRVLYAGEIRPGDYFTFKYIHSVQKTPVYEVFTIDEAGAIVLTETRMMSLGYGLPAPTKKDHCTIENNFFILKNLDKKIGKLLIRVNFIRLMELDFGASRFDLRHPSGRAGDLIEVRVLRERRIFKLMNIQRGNSCV